MKNCELKLVHYHDICDAIKSDQPVLLVIPPDGSRQYNNQAMRLMTSLKDLHVPIQHVKFFNPGQHAIWFVEVLSEDLVPNNYDFRKFLIRDSYYEEISIDTPGSYCFKSITADMARAIFYETITLKVLSRLNIIDIRYVLPIVVIDTGTDPAKKFQLLSDLFVEKVTIVDTGAMFAKTQLNQDDSKSENGPHLIYYMNITWSELTAYNPYDMLPIKEGALIVVPAFYEIKDLLQRCIIMDESKLFLCERSTENETID